jgi:opacity protein-like surface antigen
MVSVALGADKRGRIGVCSTATDEEFTMSSNYAVRALLSIVVLLGFSTSSRAQNAPQAEFSAGWRLLNIPDALGEESQTMPLGWYADVAGNLTPVIGVVGEVSGNYKNFNETSTQLGVSVNVDANLKVHTFLGGVRFNARQTSAFTPFAQALFGLAHASGKVEGQTTIAGRTFSISQSVSDSDFAFDASGGVNLNVSERFGLRVAAGYLRVGGSDGGNAFRFGVGIVCPF